MYSCSGTFCAAAALNAEIQPHCRHRYEHSGESTGCVYEDIREHSGSSGDKYLMYLVRTGIEETEEQNSQLFFAEKPAPSDSQRGEKAQQGVNGIVGELPDYMLGFVHDRHLL